MPEYALTLRFGAPDDEHAHRKAEDIAELAAAEHGTRDPIVTPADGAGLLERLAAAERELEQLRAERIVSAVFAYRDGECPRPFALHRTTDETGVSGEGTVAYGVQFADGVTVIRWLGDYASTVVWDDLDKAMHVHGHRGSTEVIWLAEHFADLAEIEAKAERADAADKLLRDVLHHLRVAHSRQAARHDNWGPGYTCAGCALVNRIDTHLRGAQSPAEPRTAINAPNASHQPQNASQDASERSGESVTP